MFLWGVCTVCQGLVKNFSSLVALRFLLGVFEAGFVPGAVYLISMYYKRYELQWRLSLFFTASILAGAFGGLLAYALAKMNGLGGYSGTCKPFDSSSNDETEDDIRLALDLHNRGPLNGRCRRSL